MWTENELRSATDPDGAWKYRVPPKVYEKVQPGDIVFVHGTSFVSKLIELDEESKISHVGIAVSECMLAEAVYGVGTRINSIVYPHMVIKRVKGITKYQQFRIAYLAEKVFLNKKYNTWGVLGWGVRLLISHLIGVNLFPKLWFQPNEYFCSQEVDTILNQVGITLVPKEDAVGDVTPSMLFHSEGLETILEVGMEGWLHA